VERADGRGHTTTGYDRSGLAAALWATRCERD